MKKCPFCQSQNPDEATACYHCGIQFPLDATAEDRSPTQPLRTRPARPISPQSRPGQRPPDATDPYGQPRRQPVPGRQVPMPDATEPFPGYRQPYRQPPYNSQPPYYGPPSYPPQQPVAQPVYPPPAPAPLPEENHRDAWPLLIAGLSLLLVFVCGLAFFILNNAAANGSVGLGDQVATQVGQVFGSAGSGIAAPSNTPTPLPTFTPTANPTQAAITDKLLSPECKGSLDELSLVSDQVKSDPLKVLNETWRKDLDQAIGDMKTHCGSLESASPIPGEIGQVQKAVNQANSEFDQASTLWNQAIDQRDPTKAIDAAKHVGEATKNLSQAISLLQKLAR